MENRSCLCYRCFVFLGFGRTASFIGKLGREMADVNAKCGVRERSPGPHVNRRGVPRPIGTTTH